MYEDLQIVYYPDPRLRQVAEPVDAFDAPLRELALRMLELMRTHRGVGLAAPQVGVNKRLFVMNHSGKPEDDRIYVNPELFDITGEQIGEEGCLSLPNINANINRGQALRMVAQDLDGKRFEQVESGYIARIWQHEFDHLNGVLILDRMGMVARMSHRRAVKELEEKYAAAHPKPKPAAKPALRRHR